eukprot:432059-Hanusia_phi.AAC.1
MSSKETFAWDREPSGHEDDEGVLVLFTWACHLVSIVPSSAGLTCCASEDSEGTISIRQSRRTISSSSGTREMNFFATKFSRSTAVASMESSAAGEEREGGRELRELGLRSLARSREKELNLIESEWSSLFFTGDISFPSSSYFLLPCGPERLPGSLLGRREMVERMVWTADRMLLRACHACHQTSQPTPRQVNPLPD